MAGKMKAVPATATESKSASRPGAPTEPELLDIDEAMARLKTTRPTFYRWLRTGKLKGMKVGRQWRFYAKDIDSFLKGEAPEVELPADIGPLIAQLHERHSAAVGKKLPPAPEASVTTAVNLMLIHAVELRASDLHLEPVATAGVDSITARVRCRVDGVLHVIAEFDGRLLRPIVERWKALAACDVHDREHPQDGRILLEIGGKRVDLRVCFLPAHFGESITARIVTSGDLQFDLERFDFAPRDRERLLRALKMPWGIVLCTGPTGSGKSTVLYGCVQHLAKPEKKIVTVENPIETALPGVTQLQVNPKIDASPVYLMRAVMRSDPDVVMIGEIRDEATLGIGIQAALTGQLVLTTLHTDEAVTALLRMVEITGEAFLISEAVKLVLAQRLIRKLCTECSQAKAPSDMELARAEAIARTGGLGDLPGRNFRKPAGCTHCKQTGFRGRTVVAETLCMSNELVAALRRGTNADELRAIAIGQGMTTLSADAVRRAALGQVYLEEALRYAPG